MPIRSISRARLSAAWRTSPACSGRVEMEGMRSSDFNSSRKRGCWLRANSSGDGMGKVSPVGGKRKQTFNFERLRDNSESVPASPAGGAGGCQDVSYRLGSIHARFRDYGSPL